MHAVIRAQLDETRSSVATDATPPLQVARPPQQAQEGALERLVHRRILVVDDNVDAAEILAMLLREIGHAVRVAFDGPSALDEMDKSKPEVVILDIGLPGLSGYDVAEAIRKDPQYEDVRIIALTGYSQAKDRARSRAAGFDEHLAKPADMDEVSAAVQG